MKRKKFQKRKMVGKHSQMIKLERMKRTTTWKLVSYLGKIFNHNLPLKTQFNVGVLVSDKEGRPEIQMCGENSSFPAPFDTYIENLEKDMGWRLDGENGIYNVFVGLQPEGLHLNDLNEKEIYLKVVSEHLVGDKAIRCKLGYDHEKSVLSVSPERVLEPGIENIVRGRFKIPYGKIDVKRVPEIESYGEQVVKLAKDIYCKKANAMDLYDAVIGLEAELMRMRKR